MPELPVPKVRPHPSKSPSTTKVSRSAGASAPSGYAELCAISNFTFLRGASHPEELVETAARLGLSAIAVTDVNSLAGIVRAHVAAKEHDIQLAVGATIRLDDPPGLNVVLHPCDAGAYARLCRLLTIGKRRAVKGRCHLHLADLRAHADGLLALVLPPPALDDRFLATLGSLREIFDDDRLSLAMSHLATGDDERRLREVAALAADARVPAVATNLVHYHAARRKALHDVLACIRAGCSLPEAGHRLHPNAERHLRSPREMTQRFAEHPRALARSQEIARRLAGFSLDQIRYEYPDEVCPAGRTPIGHLTELTWQGAADRYPGGVPEHVRTKILHELQLIDELRYAPYFLTVHDLVCFARGRGILCQGRGAAANSAVCYCLGVTAVDPDRIDLLFERFVSKERNEPPDIDIDFEHERREEVIQYIYGKYGRDRAALTAEVISYRGRSAVREVGKALGLSLDYVDRLARNLEWWHDRHIDPRRIAELGIDPEAPTMRRFRYLVREIMGFPRHLSQHVGGFVITRGPLCELVPIENAAMPDRTVIEWDKDDIDAMGMLKVDVLGLGMLTCIRKAFRFVNERERHEGTKARRHEGNSGDAHDDQNVSRPYCVATRDAAGEAGLPHNRVNAGRRAIRLDGSDEASGGVDTIEYRGGLRSAKHDGVPSLPADRSRISCGAMDADGVGDGFGDAATGSGNAIIARGDGSRVAGADPQSGAMNVDSASCLRAFVPSCLPLDLHTVPPEDPTVYDMICAADTIGVFQIESRAQMTMLPRLRPRCFYDLVIEVAIVRPGPIQGDMVHPYLRRRRGEEPVSYPSEAVKRVLGKTLGVPLFQEQAMALAIVAAGFTPGEADQLRRAMAAWKRKGNLIVRFGRRLVGGMVRNGYDRSFAERCFEQVKGFSEYGFPESHAASFALLVYVSAWLKRHEPAAFAAALINSQPMGFYAPAQIVQDARNHGVEVRPVDIGLSEWDCTLEDGDEATMRRSGPEEDRPSGRHGPQPALRLGMRIVKGLRQEDAERVVDAVRQRGRYESIEALWRASGARVATLRTLARADAFRSMGLDRQAALWQIRALRDEPLPMFDDPPVPPRPEPTPRLPPVPPLRQVMHDYAAAGLSLKRHPVSFLRPSLAARRVLPAAALRNEERWPQGRRVRVAGLCLVRQRPSTASGIVFMTLEDETGIANLIVRPPVYERCRKAARHGIVLLAAGTVERQGEVVHVLAHQIDELDGELAALRARSRDFH